MNVETDAVRAPQAVKLVMVGDAMEVEKAPVGVGGRVRVTLEAEVVSHYLSGGQHITVLRPTVVAGLEAM